MLLRCLRITLLFVWFFLMLFYGIYLYLKNRKPSINFGFGAMRWSIGINKILNLKIVVHGDIKGKYGLVVSNHVSYLDILALASIFPLRFTPKNDLKSWPVIGWFIHLSRPIWVDRSSRQGSSNALNDFIFSLKNNIPVAVFPEGTTTDGKNGILPFKSTPFESAIKSGCKIYPVLIKYVEQKDQKLSWYGDMTFLSHVWLILGMKEIIAHIFVLDSISPNDDRKRLSTKTHDYMNSQYLKIII